jgi:dGTPase
MDSTARRRIEEMEGQALAPWATHSAASKGRESPEPPHLYRTCFQRDRDRILHSKAFRRLGHKTQVFMAPALDHYRVRLTHTLEVTQIARTAARALRLNEDLAEAICLGHDLGHTPFGHLGEEVLSDFLGKPFRHNEQSLRIVDQLESREGAAARGLNLTWEVRDGILNHTWSMPSPATPEAKVARFADRIAYVNHDIDDAIRAGVLVSTDLPAATVRVLGATSSSRVDAMVGSLIESSRDGPEISMAPAVFDVLIETREFLFDRLYLRPEAAPEQERARVLLATVCRYYRDHPGELPEDETGAGDEQTRLADYIAGMTDRFALREYERITEISS